MKILFKISSLLIVFVMIASLFSSCSESAKLLRMDEDERADAFFDIVDAPGDSYSMDIELKMKGSLYGMAFKADLDGSTYIIRNGSDDPIYHTETESELKMGDGSEAVTQKIEEVSGFRDGKMYVYTKKDGSISSLCSDISAADYHAHRDSLHDISTAEMNDVFKSAADKSCDQNDDGTWTAVFTGYSAEAVEQIVSETFDETVNMLDGYRVKDLVMTLYADAELVPTEFKYELIFERSDLDELYIEPSAVVHSYITEIGDVEAPGIDFEDYNKVDDLAGLIKVCNAMNDLYSAKSIKFTLDSTNETSFMGNSQKIEEHDEGSSTTEDGKYSFAVKGTLYPGTPNETVVNIRYSRGTYSVSGKGIETQKQEMTDGQAKAALSQIFDPGSLGSASVSNIKKDEAGYTYVFTIADPNDSAIQSSYAPLGATGFKSSAEVAVKFENGLITEYKYNIRVTATLEGQELLFTAGAEIIFDYEVENSDT